MIKLMDKEKKNQNGKTKRVNSYVLLNNIVEQPNKR